MTLTLNERKQVLLSFIEAETDENIIAQIEAVLPNAVFTQEQLASFQQKWASLNPSECVSFDEFKADLKRKYPTYAL